MPFILPPKERLSEVVNIVRLVELREGEIVQVRRTKANDTRTLWKTTWKLFSMA